ncbi:hypothetical protein [uncultured Desulfobulbus sp.]|uniref:hypothetical protein n=1 Tax=uncultured Desulfobulbus sp. TaxID=239745 RepID=UPI0029C77622|nr:hypothetical protein [uncultured Desulfobulbus sp.]
MKTSGPELGDISDMLCSTCGRPFEVTITQTPEGEHETYLQCWTCFCSIKLQRHEPRRESATVH